MLSFLSAYRMLKNYFMHHGAVQKKLHTCEIAFSAVDEV